MTSVWEVAGEVVQVNATNTLKKQRFVATAGQTLFTLTGFTYALSTGSLLVFRNGLALDVGTAVTETSIGSFTLLVAASLNDIILAYGFVGISGVAVNVTSTDAALKANNLSDLVSIPSARTNLGLVIGTDVSPVVSPVFTTALQAQGTVKLGGTTPANHSLEVLTVASAVNYVRAIGAVTGGTPEILVEGTDVNIPTKISGKGTGTISLFVRAALSALFTNVASAVNYFTFSGSIATADLLLTATGTDANISINLVSKGTGVVKINGVAINSSGVTSFNARTGVVTLNSSDVTGALTFTPAVNTHTHTGVYVPVDVNVDGLGMICFMYSSIVLTQGTTTAGSNLRYVYHDGANFFTGSAATGTYRCLGSGAASAFYTTFQRIA